MLFTGLLNHAAQQNNTEKLRTSILGQYLPKYIRPMEDFDKGTSQKVKDRATPRMKQLLGMNQPYPKLYDY
jgi:ectoine hydroxylase-related dioxygenase (phytanoyl-CoA dioxygenase family)